MRVLHGLTKSFIPNALCEEPTGDGTKNYADVTCPDCLDVIADEVSS